MVYLELRPAAISPIKPLYSCWDTFGILKEVLLPEFISASPAQQISVGFFICLLVCLFGRARFLLFYENLPTFLAGIYLLPHVHIIFCKSSFVFLYAFKHYSFIQSNLQMNYCGEHVSKTIKQLLSSRVSGEKGQRPARTKTHNQPHRWYLGSQFLNKFTDNVSGKEIHKKAEAICGEENRGNLTSSYQKQFLDYQTFILFVFYRVVTFQDHSFARWLLLNVWIHFLYSPKPSGQARLPTLNPT